MSDRPTPETDAKWQELCCSNLSWYHITENIKAHCQEKERELAEAQNQLSQIHRWIERHNQDGVIDSLTYPQNLDRCFDALYDKLENDEFRKERDQFRSLNESYAACWDEIRAVLGEREQGDKTCDLDRVLKAIRERDEARELAREFRDALVSIEEYWNRDQNETAMADACWHAVNVAQDALAKAKEVLHE